MDLTKAEKKAARVIIETGLRREMEGNLQELDDIITRWKTTGSDVKETYYEVYKTLTGFNKHIARRYDGLSGSSYLLCIIGQYRDGVVTDEDLDGLMPQTQERVKQFMDL